MRRLFGLVALTISLFIAGAVAPSQPAIAADDPEAWPTTLSLPDGWLPEGIVVGDGATLYAGSRRHGGIYAIDLATGNGRVLYEGRTGGLATGLKFDSRTGYIFASGAANGDLNVIDSSTGLRVATFKLAQTPGATFVNDVIITANAAYATDSNRPVIYKIPLGVDGKLMTQDDVVVIPLSGDYQHQTGLNLNGIEATPSGDSLIGVQSTTGKLFLIDPSNGKTTLIGVNGPVNGDGLLLIDRTLYAVRNTAGNSALIKVDMAPNFLSGTILGETRDSTWETPTTAALSGNRIYLVNSRFPAGNAPTVKYWISSVDLVQPID
jgi:hypothetical protein